MIVNGKKVEKGELNTVYDLLKSLNVNSKRVVVELNKEIVNSCNYNEILLNHEDVIEIIAFVGGGWLRSLNNKRWVKIKEKKDKRDLYEYKD